MEIVNGRETVASWQKRTWCPVNKKENVVNRWKRNTCYGRLLAPAHVAQLLKRCSSDELKALKRFLQEKAENSRFLSADYQRELSAVMNYCRTYKR